MANVIDRLRVQGNPAPRNLPSQPESGLRRLGGRSGGERGEVPPGPPHTMQLVLNHSQLQSRDSGNGRNMNQAARRLEHLQRVQLANQGLSSMDLRQPDLPGKQFMLRGKPASADTLLHRHQQLQEGAGAGASAASGKSAHAALTRGQTKTAPDAVNGGVPHPTRSELREGAAVANGGVPPSKAPKSLPSSLRPPHSASATSYFLLANPHTLHQPNARSAQAGSRTRGGESGAGQGLSGGGSDGVKAERRPGNPLNSSAGSGASFELTGHQMMTPRSNTGNEDGLSFRDLYTRSPRTRQGVKDARYRDRRSPGLKDATMEPPSVDAQGLHQCLHVQQSSHPDSATEVHKHLAQFTRNEGRVNYNNPYRQTRAKDKGRALPESERRYIFDSVASYIHFNKIYPNMKEASSEGGSNNNAPNKASPPRAGFQGFAHKEGMPRVPHLAGFPKHCTDTILLRMMFKLNRPGAVHGIGLGHQAAGAPSMRSRDSTKYSDIGRHRDLDEFTIQGETPSLASHRQPPPSLSARGGGTAASLPSPGDGEQRSRKEGEGKGHRIAEEEGDQEEGDGGQEEEDTSTLITATTPGRRLAADEDDDDADDADDEASQWNVHGVGKKGKGGGKGRVGRSVKGGVGDVGEEGYSSSDSSEGEGARK